jgi:hypothetical protein
MTGFSSWKTTESCSVTTAKPKGIASGRMRSLLLFCHSIVCLLSFLLSAKMRLAGVNFCRQSTSSNASRLMCEDVFHPRNAKGNYDWNAIADGR